MLTIKCEKSFETIKDLDYIWLSLLNDIKIADMHKNVEHLQAAFNKAGFVVEIK